MRTAFPLQYGGAELLRGARSPATLFPAELNLACTQRDQQLGVVALFKTLGGGWRDEMDASASASNQQ